MIFRLVLVTLAALLCSSAFADDLSLGTSSNPAATATTLSTVAPVLTGSANFMPDNATNVLTLNASLGVPTGAFYFPSTAANSWFVYFEGQTNLVSQIANVPKEIALAGGSATGCSTSTCTSGSNKYLGVEAMSNGVGQQFTAALGYAGQSSWVNPTVSSAYSGGGTANPGIWHWTAGGTSCTTPPQGYVWVGAGPTSNAVSFVRVTNPGAGCSYSINATYNVNPANSGDVFDSGSEASGNLITLWFDYSTGVMASPGQKFCAVLFQYGDDEGSGGTFMGYIHSVSGSGQLHVTGGPTPPPTNTLDSYWTSPEVRISPLLMTFPSGGHKITHYDGTTYSMDNGGGNIWSDYGSSSVPTKFTWTTKSGYIGFAAVDTNGNPLPSSNGNGYTVLHQNNTLSSIYFPGYIPGYSQSTLGDIFTLIGSSMTTQGTQRNGWGGSLANIGMVWGSFPTASGGVANGPDMTTLGNLCKRSGGLDPLTYFQSMTATQALSSTIPQLPDATVHSWFRLNDAPAPGSSIGWFDHAISEVIGTVRGSTLTINRILNGSSNLTSTIMNGKYIGSNLFTTTVTATSGCTGSGTTLVCPLSSPPGDVSNVPISIGIYAPLTPTVAGLPVPGASVASALSVTSYPPFSVWPITDFVNGTGDVTISGTYDTTSLAGTPLNIQALLTTADRLTIIGWTSLTGVTASNGSWSGTIPKVPGGGPYYVQLRPEANSPFVTRAEPVQVGLTLGWIGQSQMLVCLSPGANTGVQGSGAQLNLPAWPAQGSVSPSVAMLYKGSAINIQIGIQAGGMSFGGQGYWPITSNTIYPSNSQYTGNGDCATAMILSIESLSKSIYGKSWPVEIVAMTADGHLAETWVDSNTHLSQTESVTTVPGVSQTISTPLTFAYSKVTDTSVGNALQNYGYISGTQVATPYTTGHMIRQGTVKVYSNGTLIAQDPASSTDMPINTQPTTCSGANGYTPTTCTINYTNGGINMVFPASPVISGPVTVTWTNIIDQYHLTAMAGLTTANSYDGDDFLGNGTIGSGFISTLMANVPSKLSAIVFEQCTANNGNWWFDPTKPPPSATAYSDAATAMTARWSFAIGNLATIFSPKISSTTPLVVLEFPNVGQSTSTHDFNNSGCQQWTEDFGTSGSAHAFNGPNKVSLVGNFSDDTTGSGTNLNGGPHETWGMYGGARIGRRAGLGIFAALTGSSLGSQPSLVTTTVANTPCSAIASPCFVAAGDGYSYNGAFYDNGCTYSQSAGGNCIDFVFNLSASGTSLATCGGTLAGTAVGGGVLNGPCTVSVATSSPSVEGFRIGGGSNVYYAGNTYDDGFDPYTTYFNGPAFNCSIVAPTIVQCRAALGAKWSATSTYTGYGDVNSAFSRIGSLVGTPGTLTGQTTGTSMSDGALKGMALYDNGALNNASLAAVFGAPSQTGNTYPCSPGAYGMTTSFCEPGTPVKAFGVSDHIPVNGGP